MSDTPRTIQTISFGRDGPFVWLSDYEQLERDLAACRALLSQVAEALEIPEANGIYTVGGVRFESLAQAAREKLEQVRREK